MMRAAFSALRLARSAASSPSIQSLGGCTKLRLLAPQDAILKFAPCCTLGCKQRSFSTHSFVLDPSVHGKKAFQSSNPGVAFCPTNLYKYLGSSGQIDQDVMQLQALEKLEDIYGALLRGTRPPRRSLYIYGPAGSGKSMVMDLFHFCLEQNGIRTRRQHFHEFLYEMHRKLHKLHLKQRNVSTHEFIRQISSEMAKELDVLCFDELAITTIQDCTLLVPLFSRIFATNLCLVTTSNRHPDNLYEDGLNRHLYLPEFLRQLHENADLAIVKSVDYREREFLKELSSDGLAKVFFGRDEVGKADAFLSGLGLNGNSMELTIGYSRKMLVESCSEDETTAKFNARRLFGGPPFFGADDYNAICQQFDTIVLDGLWVLDMADHNEAKRMTNFLDCAYELHVRVICVNMEDVVAAAIFQNLIPLENLSLKEILGSDKEMEGEDASSAEQVASKAKAEGGMSSQEGESREDIVQSIRELPVMNSQQSCYYLSADHKDWSVESKIVQTSSRKTTAGVALSEVNGESSAKGQSQPVDDPAMSFEDSSSEQHSVKGVFVAAVSSLHETGFAVKRAISRLHEMQTSTYLKAHEEKRLARQAKRQASKDLQKPEYEFGTLAFAERASEVSPMQKRV
mmetsp:Transcript_49831/g.93405  ORF Transcript_49831/g.93405 Transcript_49831/m.93405 type:complete len:626 (+) Transcript_49831:44-1921(+)